MSSDTKSPPAVNKLDKLSLWVSAMPKHVGDEGCMSPEDVKHTWAKLYSAFDVHGEEEQRSLRLAVYIYCYKNGCSRAGEYGGQMILSNGKRLAASILVKTVTKFEMRRFMRGNMRESYEALKVIDLVEVAPLVVAKASHYGVPARDAIAMADWMSGNPFFTPTEDAAAEKIKTAKLNEARRSRGGRTLEEVEAKQLAESVESQGPAVSGQPFEF